MRDLTLMRDRGQSRAARYAILDLLGLRCAYSRTVLGSAHHSTEPERALARTGCLLAHDQQTILAEPSYVDDECTRNSHEKQILELLTCGLRISTPLRASKNP